MKEVLKRLVRNLSNKFGYDVELKPIPPDPETVVNVGDSVINPENQFCNVMNPEGIQNENVFFPFESSGVVSRGTRLVVKSVVGDQLLVVTNTNAMAAGTELPSGTLILITKKAFVNMKGVYQEQEEGINKRKEFISDLLK